MKEFKEAFFALTSHTPMRWQCRLCERFITGSVPSVCDVPTGLGKTSVIAIWLLALARRAMQTWLRARRKAGEGRRQRSHVMSTCKDSAPDFRPVRMLNEFAYCPRLGYLEWVQGEFADSDDTVEGRYRHRNVECTRQRARRDEGDDAAPKIHERSVWLGSESLGLTAKIDLLEGEGRRVTPVDYKRGKRPHVPRGAYEPEPI